MLISYNWLQKYFKETLPAPEKIAEALTFHVFEIEEVKEMGNDTVFDIKVLPDRAPYALSHLGIAKEVSAILDLPIVKKEERKIDLVPDVKEVLVDIEDRDACLRYIARRIENIHVKNSPDWLKSALENLNQRSINNIVDSINYVMLDTGQPLHAFDSDKVKGKISVRYAREGEMITTLDNKEINLDPAILIIADDESPLAIAGIKGGKKAEVTETTKNFIIESANFNSTLIRRASAKINIKSEAAKRYENHITSEFAEIGINNVTELIKELNPEIKIGQINDNYLRREEDAIIRISFEYINGVLGTDISSEEIRKIFVRLNLRYKEEAECIYITPPKERLDLKIPQDIAEEVGRLFGYENIKPTISDFIKTNFKTDLNKRYLWSERIRDILIENGFSEVFTSTLSSRGQYEIEKSASDKNFIRNNLSENILKSLEQNLYNAPLLGLSQIKIFEIGKVFTESGEQTSLCIAIANTKNHKGEYNSVNEEIRQVREHLIEELGSKLNSVCTIDDAGGILILKGKAVGKINEVDGLMELNLDALLEPLLEEKINFEIYKANIQEVKRYRPVSQYPFVLRDIAVFVPTEEEADIKKKESQVKDLLTTYGTDLLVRIDLFDIFTKTFKETGEIKTSYAFRLVFQSPERTLTDEEINKIMDRITHKVDDTCGWLVR
jgi:phenylalanyl-tRNA synthetase beta chain